MSLKQKIIEKYSKKQILISLAIVFLILMFIITNLTIKINFLTKNELNIQVKPLQNIINIERNESVKLNFSIQNNNFWFCNSKCEVGLYDNYLEKYIYKEEIILDSNTKKIFNYLINISDKGHGQRIYNFDVSCHNIKTASCQTNEENILRSAIVTVNYNLTNQEEKIMKFLKHFRLNKYSLLLETFSKNISQGKTFIENIKNITTTNLNLSQENNELNSSKRFMSIAKELWNAEEYYKLYKWFDEKKLERLKEKNNDLNEKISRIKRIVNKYNLEVSELNSLLNYSYELNNAYDFYMQTENENIKTILEINKEIKKNHFILKTVDIEDILSVNFKQNQTLQQINNTIENYQILKGKKENETFNLIQLSENIQEEILTKNINLSSQICTAANKTINLFKEINKSAKKFLQENYANLINNKEFTKIRNAYHKNFIEQTSFIRYNSLADAYIINDSVLINNSLNISEQEYISTLTFNLGNKIEQAKKVLCAENTENLDVMELNNLSQIKLSNNFSATYQKENFTQVEPDCCMFNKCEKCVEKPKRTIVFLHGHSFNENDPVEASLHAFSRIINKLNKDGLIVNTGDLQKDYQFNKPISLMNYPNAIQASYYYVTYHDLNIYSFRTQKDASIEEYAERLNDMLKIIQEITESDEIILVAHSMGGLVARKYLQKYQPTNVPKLIMIGTPNKGIEGFVKTICSTTGATEECEDMNTNSEFIKNLNNNNKEFTNTDIYMLYGTGCKIGKAEGDGVVLVKNAILEGAENIEIKGDCEGLHFLHSSMLNPEKYNKVYMELIKLIYDK